MLREIVRVVIVAQITLQNVASESARVSITDALCLYVVAVEYKSKLNTGVMQRGLAAYQQQLNAVNRSCRVDVLSDRARMALVCSHEPRKKQRGGLPHLVLRRR